MNASQISSLIDNGLSILILSGGGLLCLLLDALWGKKASPVVYIMALLSILGAFVAIYFQWQSPVATNGSTLLVMDLFTLYIIGLLMAVGFITLLNALSYIQIHKNLTAEFCALLLFTLVGMIFLFASNNLLMNFIGLETMSLAIYVLVGSHRTNFKSNEAALKYFVTGGVASAVFLYGVSLFYGSFQTLELGAISQMIPAQELSFLPKMAVAFILVGLFFKMAVVPFHFWAPDVYEGAPSPITGFMATGVKIAIFGFTIRFFLALKVLDYQQVQTLLQVLVVLTLVLGNVLAIVQSDIKRMLAYSSISHAGFLLLGLLAAFKDGQFQNFDIFPVLFYLLGYLITTLGAFAILSLLVKNNSESTDFLDLQGLGHKHPILAGLFTLFMFSMVGMPGTVGFAGKYSVISMAVQNNHILLSVLAVIMSVVSAYYYLRPSVTMFFKKSSDDATSPIQQLPITATMALVICAYLVLQVGILPDQLLELAQIAASKL